MSKWEYLLVAAFVIVGVVLLVLVGTSTAWLVAAGVYYSCGLVLAFAWFASQFWR